MKKPLREMDRTGRTCPVCRVGELVHKNGKWGVFIGCTSFPKCTHTEKIAEACKNEEELTADAILKAHGCGNLANFRDLPRGNRPYRKN